MIKHIIFDFDGTIADSGGLGVQIVNELAEKYKYKKMTMEELRILNNNPIKQRFKQIGVPLYKLPKMSVECLRTYKKFVNSLKAFEGIPELINALKKEGLGLSIVSSNSVENIKTFLENNELDAFSDIISAKKIFGKDKSIKKYLKKSNLESKEVIYIGDELRDIEACKRVPIKVISVAWGFDSLHLLKSGNPDYIAYKPEDILTIVKSIMESAVPV